MAIAYRHSKIRPNSINTGATQRWWWLEKNFWEDSECALSALVGSPLLLTLDQFHYLFLFRFTTSVATRHCRCWQRSDTLWVVMPVRLALCDLGAPGWGEPWFPHSAVLLYSQPLYGDVGDVAFLVLFCLPPYSIRRWFNVITPLSAFWRCWTGQPFTFSLWCAFFVCLLVVLCVWFCVCFVCGFFAPLRLWRLLGLCIGPRQLNFWGFFQ
jgi:hypothetical protein